MLGAVGVVLEEPDRGERLLLALQLVPELPARLVAGHEGPPDGRVHLDHERRAPREVPGAGGDALVDLVDEPVRPPGPQGTAHAVVDGAGEAADVVPRPEQVVHRLRPARDRHLLQGDDVRVERPQRPRDERAAALPPRVRRAQHVERAEP